MEKVLNPYDGELEPEEEEMSTPPVFDDGLADVMVDVEKELEQILQAGGLEGGNQSKHMPGRHDQRTHGRRVAPMFQAALAESGGFTYHVRSKRMPQTGYVLPPYPERSKVYDKKELTQQHIYAYQKSNQDLLRLPDHFFGGWHDTDPGKVYLDISIVTSNAMRATELCKQFKQRAFFDLSKGEEVRVLNEEEAHKATNNKSRIRFALGKTEEDIPAMLEALGLSDIPDGSEEESDESEQPRTSQNPEIRKMARRIRRSEKKRRSP